jgi:hypothetical protein
MASGGQSRVTVLSGDASEYIPRENLYLKSYGTSAARREVAEYLANQTLAVDVKTATFAVNFPSSVNVFRIL